ncbi:4-(cytidine 5'-diphospho)-2-C-methyl-D-erythritol kinase [Deinococcus deserti]|uniref:4-diphosphocytidyl-2-C-methyl-D-erythritol kinase n=1 Tax=Deinococcus deserti (strain DSM 17065 / CIP 109153 / LMG 22923 / VCD115) TaxID=546414 RepID=C1CXL8_DEIDV|nr:4-(cytidine 5'-diphospho)-2-C-methyl-D-erythritol kinase [Deinococcus deserti]ACO44824.2 putative 4-diphosphocytidyl-2C-methyl-D-erythritol kinase [Deinococcus deserti VCD115]
MQVFAPAKINLGLSVLGVRSDGYHDLHSLMVPLATGDELELEPASELSLRVLGADLPCDSRNLVYRAAHAYLDAAGMARGAAITLHKQLPLASGLGGGSSDAASTLRALHEMYPADVDLPGLALRLGADVPFFLLGSAAIAEGVGERLSPVQTGPLSLVLLNPGVEVSAREAYLWLDETGAFTSELDVQAIVQGLAAGSEEVPYFNALQPAVVARHPLIQVALDALRDAGLHAPLMSGSGSTCFALAQDAMHADRAAQVLAARYPDWWIQATSTQ